MAPNFLTVCTELITSDSINWDALGAIGSILAALATFITVVVALYISWEERRSRNKEIKQNILSSLELELFANYQALINSHMVEVELSNLAYINFIGNSSLFNISNNKDLYLAIDMLYKNFNYYNYKWRESGAGSSLYEIRSRIFLYLLNIFQRNANIDNIIQDISDVLSTTIKELDLVESDDEGFAQLDFNASLVKLKENIKESNNFFYESEDIRNAINSIDTESFWVNVRGYPIDEAKSIYYENFNVFLLDIFDKYIKNSYKFESTITLENIENIINKFN